MVAQLCVVEVLKALGIEVAEVVGISFSDLVSAYWHGRMNLSEVVECVYVVAKASNEAVECSWLYVNAQKEVVSNVKYLYDRKEIQFLHYSFIVYLMTSRWYSKFQKMPRLSQAQPKQFSVTKKC